MAESINNFNGLLDDNLIFNSNIGYFTTEESNNIIKDCRSLCSLSTLHINIRSLNANCFKLKDLLSIYDYKFDLFYYLKYGTVILISFINYFLIIILLIVFPILKWQEE